MSDNISPVKYSIKFTIHRPQDDLHDYKTQIGAYVYTFSSYTLTYPCFILVVQKLLCDATNGDTQKTHNVDCFELEGIPICLQFDLKTLLPWPCCDVYVFPLIQF